MNRPFKQSNVFAHTYEEKIKFAKSMRSNPTQTEKLVWSRLRSRQLEVKFRRQSLVHGIIADFYCPTVHLVVEIDGSVHNAVKDRIRDIRLANHRMHTLRYTNNEILCDLDNVISRIKREVDYLLSKL